MLQFLMDGHDFEFVEHVDSNLTTVEIRHMDILLKVLLDEEPVLIHCEIQTDDSVYPNMVRRNVGYLGRCYEKYGLPIYSFVLYLRSTAGHSDPGGYFQDVPNHRFIVEYQVVRLSEIDGEVVLAERQPGLMPFTPLMKHPTDMSAVEWTTHCVEMTQSLSVDAGVRNNLLVELWIMSGLAHERQDILTLFPEGIVQESTVYQMIIERGIEQGIERGIEQGRQLGAKEFAIDNILNLLNNRFKVNVAATLTPSLEAIDDLDNFRILIREASESEHLEDFLHVLETYGNGMQ
jgi:predicted transposase YdaD